MEQRTEPPREELSPEDFNKEISKNDSVIELLDAIMNLDRIMPYLEISENEEIKAYFEKKGISNVANKGQLASFYNALEGKIEELAYSDGRARSFFEKREYLKQLDSLPQRLSQLEKTASVGFDELKPVLKAVFEYVWNAVIEKGFRMKGGENTYVRRRGKKQIVDIELYYGHGETFNIELHKKSVNKKEGDGLFSSHLKNKRRTSEFFIKAGGYGMRSIDRFVEDYKEGCLENSNQINKARKTLRKILILPTEMNNYLLNYIMDKEKDLKHLFEEVKTLSK